MKSKKTAKVTYGKKDLLPARIEPKDEKVRISIIMEGDLLDLIRQKAEEAGKPYQTFMKDTLRQTLSGVGQVPPDLGAVIRNLEHRVDKGFDRVEHEIKDLKKRA